MHDDNKTRRIAWLAGVSLSAGLGYYALRKIQNRTSHVAKAITINCTRQRLRAEIMAVRELLGNELPGSDLTVESVTAIDEDNYQIQIAGSGTTKKGLIVSGKIKEAPGQWGTELHVTTEVKGWRTLGFLTELPADYCLFRLLSSIKQTIEVGEVATTKGQPSGRHASLHTKHDDQEIEDNEQRSIAS